MKKILLVLLFGYVTLFSQNIEELKKIGREGDTNALMQLGLIYENGDGVARDLKIAKRYYSQAKELGSEDAKISLSLLELSKQHKTSKHLTNNVKIKLVTGLVYTIGASEVQNLVSKAKQNDKEALFALATLYDNGYGDIEADDKKALLLYIKAAKLGSKKAKDILARKKLANSKNYKQ